MWKRAVRLWWVVRGDAKLLWFALLHPQCPPWLKLGTAGLVLYLLSPVDLIPDVIPVVGLADDLVLIPLAIRFLYRRLPEWLRAEVEQRAGGTAPRRGGRPGAGDVIDLKR